MAIDTPDTPKNNNQNEKLSRNYTYAFVALAVLAIGFLGGFLGAASQNNSGANSLVQQKTILKNEANVISDIAKSVGPSVVSVSVTSQSAAINFPFSDWFGSGGGEQAQQSAGTGIILTKDGLIMTNRHVVPTGTTAVSVTLSDGTVFEGVQVIGRTSNRDSLDIAFLQIGDLKGHTLTPAKLGDSSDMKVGDTVVAIGNALGQFQNTVTSGIISGYGRSIEAGDGRTSLETLDDLFQTDAAINEGNSGGPLVNLAGEVIGVNTAIASNSEGIGFAIPINNVRGLITSVEETGKLQRPYLGIIYVMLTDDTAKQYSLSVNRGAYVPKPEQMGGSETVISGGPASKAGVEPGDIITKVDGIKIDEKKSLVSILGNYKVGKKVELTVVRGNDTIKLTATLAAAPTD